MLILLLLYIIPMFICFYIAYKVKTNKEFGQAIGISTYAGLWTLVGAALMPFMNILVCVFALTELADSRYFSDIKYTDKGE